MSTAWRRPVAAVITSVAVMIPIGLTAQAAHATTTGIVINEVESNGGSPDDWIELMNTGSSSADVSGLVLGDNSTKRMTIPTGSTIPAGGFLAIDVAAAFGLGAADSARLFESDGATVIDQYSWTAHATTTYGRNPDGTGAFATTTSPTKGAANDFSIPIRINEVESNGGTPGDWIELMNIGSSTVDLSNMVLADNSAKRLPIAAGTTIAAGAFLAFDTESQFGLGAADSARLFDTDGTTLIDHYDWTAHATTTYGRNPDGTGTFTTTTTSTKGAANDFGAVIPPAPTPATVWPGGTAVSEVDTANFFGTNLSGLDYEPSGTGAQGSMWAVKNGPSTLYHLVPSGSSWVADNTKDLNYTDGTGDPDAEGVTITDAGSSAGIFVSTERNNDVSGTSRPAILKFVPSTTGTSLNAVMDWNLTSDLPVVAANSGLEAITWVPDATLVAQGFIDDHTGALYNPATYADHAGGLFFVGLEANGSIYAYALNQLTGGYTRVASFASGFPSIMDLQYDPETGHMWADCDNTCTGQIATLDIAQSGVNDGHYGVTTVYAPPTGLPNYNNEGFAIAPQATCVNGSKAVFWSDDDQDNGHALRQGTISCTALPPVVDPPVTPTVQLASATVTGPASVGSKLTAHVAGLTPATAALSYQWLRNGASIASAHASSYKLTATDVAARLSVRVTAALAGYNATTVTSAQTAKVTKVFTKTAKVSIVGKAKVGKRVAAVTGKWSPKPKFSYHWFVNGKEIKKATSSTLTIARSMTGKKVTVTIVAKKTGYTAVLKTSAATAKVKK